jgi:hypothetical protein
MSDDPLKQEFTGSNGEIVRVELPYQGYDVEFEKMKDDDPLFNVRAFKRNAEYDFIQPLIWLEAKRDPHGVGPAVIHRFEPSLKFSVEFSMNIFEEFNLTADRPIKDPQEIKIFILDEHGEPNEHGRPVWEPYPTSITASPEPDKWIATIAIVEWTSHACYGR